MVFGRDNYASHSHSQPLPRASELERKRRDANEGENRPAANFDYCWFVAGMALFPLAGFGVVFTIGPTMIADVCFFSRKRDSFRMGLVVSLHIFHARCRRLEAGRNNDHDEHHDKHKEETETETSLATEEEDSQIEHEQPCPKREEEEEEFLVRLGFRWNGVSYVDNHEELVSATVYKKLIAGTEQNTNNQRFLLFGVVLDLPAEDNNNKTLPIVALLRHQTLQWKDGNLLGTKHVDVSGTTVVVGGSDAQEYYSKSLVGDDHHCGTRLTKFLFFSCATAFTSFVLAVIFDARSTLELVGTVLGHLLVGILLASYLQYRWWEKNLREYRVVVVDGKPPPTIDDDSNEVELGRTIESTSHAATTMDGLFGTITIDSTAGDGQTSHATMDGLFGTIA